VDTDTRAAPPAEAYARVRQLADALRRIGPDNVSTSQARYASHRSDCGSWTSGSTSSSLLPMARKLAADASMIVHGCRASGACRLAHV
jgi:hypothetical protein